jgi:hypothetical protein
MKNPCFDNTNIEGRIFAQSENGKVCSYDSGRMIHLAASGSPPAPEPVRRKGIRNARQASLDRHR